MLRAVGRPGAPRNLQGLELWRDAFLAADLRLARVVARMEDMLEEAREAHAELVELLARPRAVAETRSRPEDDREQIVLTNRVAPPEGWEVVCRVRSGPGASRETYRNLRSEGEGSFWVDPMEYPDRKLPL